MLASFTARIPRHDMATGKQENSNLELMLEPGISYEQQDSAIPKIARQIVSMFVNDDVK